MLRPRRVLTFPPVKGVVLKAHVRKQRTAHLRRPSVFLQPMLLGRTTSVREQSYSYVSPICGCKYRRMFLRLDGLWLHAAIIDVAMGHSPGTKNVLVSTKLQENYGPPLAGSFLEQKSAKKPNSEPLEL